jgi:hypothetical protein
MAKGKNRQADPDATIKLLVQRRDGNVVIEVPAYWRVTFGYINPSSSGMAAHRGDGHCLRLWEGEKLRAVLCDVTGFRDLSIPYAKEIRKETGSSEWSHDSTGEFKETVKRKTDRELVVENPDDPF